MSQVPDILTDRLRLRGFQPDDAEDVFRYASDPAVLLYTTGCTPQRVDESRAFVDGLIHKPAGAYAWAVCLKSALRVIGAVEFGVGDGTEGSIDYALAKEHWNKGLMTEACRAVLDWGFCSHAELERVTTSAVVVNRASTRVMEKCGMRFLRNVTAKWDKLTEPVELAVYTIDRERWNAQRTSQEGSRRA